MNARGNETAVIKWSYMSSSTDHSTTRRGLLACIAAAGTAPLAGCGNNGATKGGPETPGSDTGSGSGEPTQEPQLYDVNLMLEPDSEQADFTNSEEYGLGLKAELRYSDGSSEIRDVTDYEVEDATVRKTSEDGEYEVVNISKNTVPNTEFTDEDLKKAGHYQSLDNIDTQEGDIILDSDDLITGYSQIDLDINVTDQEISDYIDNYQDQEIIQVHKPEQQALQDLQVQGPKAIELYQKFRELDAEKVLENGIIAGSDYHNWAEFKDTVRERVQQELAEDENPTLQDELAHWGTEFGRLYMEDRNGAGPSGGTRELAFILADAELVTSDLNIIPGQIIDRGHNSNPVYIPGSRDPSDGEFWNGRTVNVNTKREEAADTPAELTDYKYGDFGSIFKDSDNDPSGAMGTFSSFMVLNEDDDHIDREYSVELVSEFADDTEVWQDNLQHLMETAVGDLFATEHNLEATGSPENPEVELK